MAEIFCGGQTGGKAGPVDMLHGPLPGKIVRFALPVLFSGILQLLFNAADIIIVGRFSGSNALAAVGSNAVLINLLVNLLAGLSVGTAVTTAFYYGAGEWEQVKETVHTSVTVSIAGGILFGFFGFAVSPSLLRVMRTPPDLMEQAALYLKIYFCGLPAMAVYNFSSAILRSMGDTKRPLYYLMIGGSVNVALNLLLVAGFHMDVAGVAIATVISQAISAVLTLRCLKCLEKRISLEWGKLRISRRKFVKILQVGIPAGLQSMIFAVTNVMVQSAVNDFGELAVAGNSAAASIEGFIYIAMDAFYQAAQTFTGQNIGGGKTERINRVLLHSLLMVSVTGLALGLTACVFSGSLLRIYLPGDGNAVEYGRIRMGVIAASYFLCGIMVVLSGVLRGMGDAWVPLLITAAGSCLFNIWWIFTVYPSHRTLTVLYLSYPASWLVTEAMYLFHYVRVRRRAV